MEIAPIQAVRDAYHAGRAGAEYTVEGVVTAEPGTFVVRDAFYIEDKTGGVSIRTGVPLVLKVGDRVRLKGRLLHLDAGEPELETATILSRVKGSEPTPMGLSVSQALAGEGLGRLVRLRGRVRSTSVGDTRDSLTLEEGGKPILVYIRRGLAEPARVPKAVSPGSTVEVLGILMPGEAEGNMLRLRWLGDIRLTNAPITIPWHWILGFGAVVCVILIWSFSLRRMVRVKTRETELLLAEAQEASRLKSEFLANVSHEIRTPLHGILGLQELLLESPLSVEQRGFLQSAQESSRHLLTLLNDFLDISRIEADKLVLLVERYEPLNIARRAIRTMEARAAEKRLEIRLKASTTPPALMGDHDRVQQVLLNVLSNAVKFTERGSVVLTVSHRVLAGGMVEVSFSVADTGIGIPEDKRQLVFEAFRQADGTITRRYGGSGLGLAIASRLVERMGGRLSVESEVGRGSTFTIVLSAAQAEPEEQTAAIKPAPAQASGRLRVLVAEDNEINRHLIHRLLEKRGHEVCGVANGLAALERATRESFDLILMDLQMPVMDGLSAAQRIRQAEQGRRTPIVALTAHAFAHDHAECLASGMDAVLTKPFTGAALDNTLLQLL